MCSIFFSYKTVPHYPLIVASNRDEYYHRPTKGAHFWKDTSILAGKDLEKGGTWMGVTKAGRFAALTNVRNLYHPLEGTRSRGELVKQFLMGKRSPKHFMDQVQDQRHAYPGFNLLVYSKKDDALLYYSNVENHIRTLGPGIYGLSNASLNTPWPKVERGKRAFQSCITPEPHMACLFNMLNDDTKANDADLPDTGLSLEFERDLSSIFINTDGYGTRASTVITANDEKLVTFTEKNHELGTSNTFRLFW